jgi:hypothetical protein
MLKRIWYIYIFLLIIPLTANAQKADFKAAEKFRAENLVTKYGDLAVNANWIENSDIFWYSFKTPEGKNFFWIYLSLMLRLISGARQNSVSELTQLNFISILQHKS